MIGTAAPDGKLISAAAAVFGSQSIVVSVDVRRTCSADGRCDAVAAPATSAWNRASMPADAAIRRRRAVRAVDRPGGRPDGIRHALMKEISAAVQIPVVACGGAGSLEDISLLHSS